MTTDETQDDETMQKLRDEFATKVWPQIERDVGQLSAALPPVHQAAWIGFRAGRLSDFLKTPTDNQ